MGISSEQVDRIRARCPAPKWIEDYWEFRLGLEARLEDITRRVGIRWGCEDDRAEFISDLLSSDYDRRAFAGTLLIGYQGDGDGAIEWLTRPMFVRLRALTFLEALRQGTPLEGDHESIAGGGGHGIDWSSLRRLFRIRVTAPIDRPTQYAGIQLRPLVDWTTAAHKDLERDIFLVIGTSNPAADLEQAHEAAARQIANRRNKLLHPVDAVQHESKAQENLDLKLNKLLVEALLKPLKPDALAKLFKLDKDNVRRIGNRYWHSLPEILPDLYGTWLELGEPEPGGPPEQDDERDLYQGQEEDQQ